MDVNAKDIDINYSVLLLLSEMMYKGYFNTVHMQLMNNGVNSPFYNTRMELSYSANIKVDAINESISNVKNLRVILNVNETLTDEQILGAAALMSTEINRSLSVTNIPDAVCAKVVFDKQKGNCTYIYMVAINMSGSRTDYIQKMIPFIRGIGF